jgi:hypothetical protein
MNTAAKIIFATLTTALSFNVFAGSFKGSARVSAPSPIGSAILNFSGTMPNDGKFSLSPNSISCTGSTPAACKFAKPQASSSIFSGTIVNGSVSNATLKVMGQSQPLYCHANNCIAQFALGPIANVNMGVTFTP